MIVNLTALHIRLFTVPRTYDTVIIRPYISTIHP